MKIITPAALIFALLVFLAAHGQAEEHYIYKDAQGRLVLSNQSRRPETTSYAHFDLPEFRDAPIQQAQESVSTRSTGKLEGTPKQDQKK